MAFRPLWLLLLALPARTQDLEVPASDYLNQHLPGWLRFGGEARARLEGYTGLGFRPGSNDHHLLTRVRVNLSVHPARRLAIFAQTQDARVFGTSLSPAPTAYRDSLDLRIAYLELGDSEKDALTVRAGRQELNFGEQRLVGSNQWRNTAQTFDAVRLTLRRGRARLDAFSSSAVAMQPGFNRSAPGNNLHGLYGAVESRGGRISVEPYLLWRLNPGWRCEEGTPAQFDARLIGAHVFGKPGAGWDFDMETVALRGEAGPDRVRAWAAHWRAGRRTEPGGVPVRWLAEYNRASGDRDPRDGVQQLFQPPYPAVHDRFGLSDQIGWRNMHHIRTGAEVEPGGRWTISPNLQNYWVSSRTDGIYTPSGTLLARVPGGAQSSRVGWEIDISAQWRVSPLVQVGFGWAHLFPGAFLREATPGVAYNSGYGLVSYRF